MKMKRKRKNACSSPLLDDSPKRTKVHAQRKFAQGSNVNSPVITPIRELESESPKTDVLPEPVELLPRKRPNTEDFLTFLCFRGTPILPPSLNFFNTASIVDTNGQVHEIKSEASSKHGPIDIAKCGVSSERPFVAFGVRKRADPVVISRQMDRKRRHALAIQALRRKYQEQKMAKIRALTISKLSEKVTNKTLVRSTNTVSKTETITKKTNTVQKTKVVATKHIKVTTRTLKTTLKPKLKLKQNMCLRSFRGRFIQQELPFRKKIGQDKAVGRSLPERVEMRKRSEEARIAIKQNQAGPSKESKPLRRKIVKKMVASAPAAVGSRFTRSSLTNTTKSEIVRKQIKRRILIPNPNAIIKTKPRSLRLTTVKKSVLSRRKSNSLKMKQKVRAAIKIKNSTPENVTKPEKAEESRPKRSPVINKGDTKHVERKDLRQTINKNIESRETNKSTDIKKDFRKVTDLKKEVQTISDRDKRHLTRSLDVRKEVNTSTDIKRKLNLTVEIKKSTRISNVIHKKINTSKNIGKNESDKGSSPGKGPEERIKRLTRRSDITKKPNEESNLEKTKSTNNEKGKGTPSTSQKKAKPKIVNTKSDEPVHPSTLKNAKNIKKPKEKTIDNNDKSENKPEDRTKQHKESGEVTKKVKKSKQKDDKEITKKHFDRTNTNSKSNESICNTENKNGSNSAEIEEIADEEDDKKCIHNNENTTSNIDNTNDQSKEVPTKNNNAETENSENVSVENIETEMEEPTDLEKIKSLDTQEAKEIKIKDIKSTDNVKKMAAENNEESKEPDNIKDTESTTNQTGTNTSTGEDTVESEINEEDSDEEDKDKPKEKRPKVETIVTTRKTSISIRKQTEVIKETVVSTKINTEESSVKKAKQTKTKRDTKKNIKERLSKEKLPEDEENVNQEGANEPPSKKAQTPKNTNKDIKEQVVEEQILVENDANESSQTKISPPKIIKDTNKEEISDENALNNQEECREFHGNTNEDSKSDDKEQTSTTKLLDDEELINETPTEKITEIKAIKDPEEQTIEENLSDQRNILNDQENTNELSSTETNPNKNTDVKEDITEEVDEKVLSDEDDNVLVINEDFSESSLKEAIPIETKKDTTMDDKEQSFEEKEDLNKVEHINELPSKKTIQCKTKDDTKMDLKEETGEEKVSSETVNVLTNQEEEENNEPSSNDLPQMETKADTEREVKEQLGKGKLIGEENSLNNQEDTEQVSLEKITKPIKKYTKRHVKQKSGKENLSDEEENHLSDSEGTNKLPLKKAHKTDKDIKKDNKEQSNAEKHSDKEENVEPNPEDGKEISLKKTTQDINKKDTEPFVKELSCKETVSAAEENASRNQENTKELLSKKAANTKMKKEVTELSIKNQEDQEESATSKQECINEAPIKKAIHARTRRDTRKAVRDQSSKSKFSDQEETASSSRDEPPVKRAIRSKRDMKRDVKGKVSDYEDYTPRSQRLSRKTKEAAAIYMEILSHKLVDNKIDDDDTISIDSFPELPNVKRTEQREIELKAKAKTSKDDVNDKTKSTTIEVEDMAEDDIKETQMEDKKEENVGVEKDSKNEPVSVQSCSKAKKKDGIKVGKRKSIANNSGESEEEVIKPKVKKSNVPEKVEVQDDVKTKLRKSNPEIIETVTKRETPKLDNPSTSKTTEETTKSKLRKSDVPKASEIVEENKPRRLTRHSLYANRSDDCDSDESFHVNVKVPRKKKNTRSRVSPRVTKGLKQSNLSSSESDRSTTSDVNVPTPVNKAKNKKFSKTKSMKKSDNFSDSDEEAPPAKSVESNKKSPLKPEKPKETPKETGKSKKVISKNTEPSPTRASTKSKSTQKSPEPETTKIEPKPKRECAKLPQNYLPMFSSSDEDEIFHGFDEKTEKNAKTCESSCGHAPPLLDLLNKDLGRRFGKEKVNMSNEQIEKWLKDAALAGSSIKKENDEMLKFGERIPTETNLELAETIDTEKLKQSLSELAATQGEPKEVKSESTSSTPVKADSTSKADCGKPQLDRKLIFRKSKENAPNVNAFSPENECSVYAFGEENEDVISTPFRRPSRRPSSTATSKSEDESCKQDESSKSSQFRKPTVKQEPSKTPGKEEIELPSEVEDNKQFYVPQNPTIKSTILKPQSKPLFKSKSSEKLPDVDEFKYKIPSSPSASSSSSAKLYKRQPQKHKARQGDAISPVYVSDFPKQMETAKLVEAPVFHPTEQEFQDPLEYIERIRHKAEQFGICRIVPPSTFKPECKVTDDMRFTAYNQYVGKMLYRWGPNFKELMAIKKYLETQNIALNHPPWIGGMEIDLPRLYQTVQALGGLREVIEKKKWPKVSDVMKIPKSAQDRVTKLDDIYCKYLLPYDILSPAEREKLFDEVETEWAKRESKTLLTEEQKTNMDSATDGDSDIEDRESEECTTKGRNMALNAFYRIARNTMSMYFKTNEPLPQEVEQEYWKYVTQRQNHICVHSGSIDCGNWGYGFAVSKHSPFAKHPWNLKVLTNNSGSVLRCLGPLMGVTVPTLHVGMVFSACCWYRDPHGLPWIEYLHTGGSKIWYGIPNTMGEQFQLALKKLTPNYCKNKELWLPSDTVMVPPNLLVENQVSLCHTVQEPGQFVVVFPKAFTSSISTGYVVSESVYFAPIYWLKTARSLFDALRQSNEPAMFSFDRLLLNVVNDPKCNIEIVRQVMPMVQELCGKEIEKREKLYSLGEITREKLPIPEVNKGKKKKFQQGEEGDYECELCRSSLFLSMVFDTVEGITYCLDHATEMAEKTDLQLANCKFMFTYDDEELKLLPEKGKNLMDSRLQKKVPNKFAGMPTLLGK